MWPWSAKKARAVTMYTRDGCHLCDEAWAVLTEAGRRWGFVPVSVDIAGDEALEARFGLEIPVVEIDGVVRFRGVVNRVLLERVLRAS